MEANKVNVRIFGQDYVLTGEETSGSWLWARLTALGRSSASPQPRKETS